MLIDGHVHLEKGPYSVEWVHEFIRYALDRGIGLKRSKTRCARLATILVL